jgi:hypothetical protein
VRNTDGSWTPLRQVPAPYAPGSYGISSVTASSNHSGGYAQFAISAFSGTDPRAAHSSVNYTRRNIATGAWDAWQELALPGGGRSDFAAGVALGSTSAGGTHLVIADDLADGKGSGSTTLYDQVLSDTTGTWSGFQQIPGPITASSVAISDNVGNPSASAKTVTFTTGS